MHREREAAQTLLGPKGSSRLGEKMASAVFMSKHTLGLSLVPKESIPIQNAAPRS